MLSQIAHFGAASLDEGSKQLIASPARLAGCACNSTRATFVPGPFPVIVPAGRVSSAFAPAVLAVPLSPAALIVPSGPVSSAFVPAVLGAPVSPAARDQCNSSRPRRGPVRLDRASPSSF